jgi:hypothetical protein
MQITPKNVTNRASKTAALPSVLLAIISPPSFSKSFGVAAQRPFFRGRGSMDAMMLVLVRREESEEGQYISHGQHYLFFLIWCFFF